MFDIDYGFNLNGEAPRRPRNRKRRAKPTRKNYAPGIIILGPQSLQQQKRTRKSKHRTKRPKNLTGYGGYVTQEDLQKAGKYTKKGIIAGARLGKKLGSASKKGFLSLKSKIKAARLKKQFKKKGIEVY